MSGKRKTKRQKGPELFPLEDWEKTTHPVPNVKKPALYKDMSLVDTDSEEGYQFLFCHLCRMKMAFKNPSHRVTVVRSHMSHSHSTKWSEEDPEGNESETETTCSGDYFDFLGKRKRNSGILSVTASISTKNRFDFFPIDFKLAEKESQVKFEFMISYWLAKHMRPYTTAEDKALAMAIYFAQKTEGLLLLPNRHTVTRRQKKLVVVLRSFIRDTITSECNYYSITSDIWTSAAQDPYISLTIHYMSKEFVMKKFTLEVEPFPGSHTAEKICEKINEMMHRWQLKKEKCIYLITDNATSMINARKLLQMDGIGCAAHTFHLVIMSVLRKENESDKLLEHVGNVVAKFRRIAKYFRNSPSAAGILGDLYEKLDPDEGKQVRKLVIDVKTRWNSLYAMLDRFRLMRPALLEFFHMIDGVKGRTRKYEQARNLKRPNPGDWLILEYLTRILSRFDELTTELSAFKRSTFLYLVPIINDLNTFLNMNAAMMMDDVDVTMMNGLVDVSHVTMKGVKIIDCCEAVRKKLQQQLLVRFKYSELPVMAKWGPFLHPKYANGEHLPKQAERAKQEINLTNEVARIAKEEIQDIFANVKSPKKKKSNQKEMVRQKYETFRSGDLQDQRNIGEMSEDQEAPTIESKIRNELVRYRAEARTTVSSFNKLEITDLQVDNWWSGNSERFPLLAVVARYAMSGLATSVASEHAFSTAGNIVTKQRTRLDPNSLSDLVLIHDTELTAEEFEEFWRLC